MKKEREGVKKVAEAAEIEKLVTIIASVPPPVAPAPVFIGNPNGVAAAAAAATAAVRLNAIIKKRTPP